MTREMHPQRWGDPDAAAALPEGARSLVEAVFGPATPAEPVSGALPAPALPPALLAALGDAVGEAYVSTDDDLRRHRTRGKSTPDLLRARAGDLPTRPTPSSSRGATTRSRPSSRWPSSTTRPWCRSAAARASPAVWPPAATGTPASSASTSAD